MARAQLKSFPYPAADYDFPGAALHKHWPRLHQGDCEPYPDASKLKALIAAHPALQPPMPVGAAAETLQAAWRAYHHGEFREATRLGLSVGPIGHNVANKAANTYTTYLETAKQSRLATFLESARRAEQLQKHAPTLPNAWYLHAQALGRYAQGISVVKALAEGLGGKVKASLERTLALEPRHADAHIAFGAYHAEVIDKIGALVGGLTYGASTDAGVRHFQKALKLNPSSAIGRIEYADGLLAMFGESKMAQATRLYEEAAKCVPADAMERLDVELARAELAD
jgi:tetratricopeptide (TPR) repeat protein